MDAVESWVRHLRARRRSPRTVVSYRSDVLQLFDALGDVEIGEITERDIEGYFVTGLQRGLSRATLVRRRRSLHQFFGWLADRGVVRVNPVAAAVIPSLPEPPPDVLTDTEMAALLGACSKTRSRGRAGEFETHRDTAIVLLLITTGMRASELIGLPVDDVDLPAETIRVTGRQGRERSVSLLRFSVAALDVYLRARASHRLATSTSLWLGEKGPLTSSGLRQMLERRCRMADIRAASPHLFRRTFAHEALRRGTPYDVVMDAGGWSTDQMPRRYAPSVDAADSA